MSIINLLPDDYIQSRREQRSNKFCIILLGLVMASVVAAYFVSQRTLSNTQQVLDRINDDYANASQLMTQLEQLQQQKTSMTEKAKTISTLLERVPRSYLLAIVSKSLPEDASLVNFNLYPKRIILPSDPKTKDAKFNAKVKSGPPPSQVIAEMEITGFAGTDVDVARFIANIARNEITESVDLVYSQEKTLEFRDDKGKIIAKPVVREFQVRVVLKQNIDVIDIMKQQQVAAASAKSQEGSL